MASDGRVVALQWNKPRNKAREYIQCVTLLRPRPRGLHTRRPRSSPPTRKTEGRRRGGWPARGLWRSLINIISGRRARCRGESAREKKATDGTNEVTGVTAVGDSKWGYACAVQTSPSPPRYVPTSPASSSSSSPPPPPSTPPPPPPSPPSSREKERKRETSTRLAPPLAFSVLRPNTRRRLAKTTRDSGRSDEDIVSVASRRRYRQFGAEGTPRRQHLVCIATQ